MPNKMLNIVPVNDLQVHREDEHCSCNPRVEYENGIKLVIHNSFDGREYNE